MRINLHKDLASGGWHSSICTTYSVDPQFYDLYIERRLRSFGCQNNILMADARMLKLALDAMPEGFAAAGTRYAVLPVKAAGAFHPKIHLRLGERKARLIVGSANATAAGWQRNQEVVSALNWQLGDDGRPDNAALGALIRRATEFLTRWLDRASGEAMRYKLQFLRRRTPWLEDLEPPRGPIILNDGTAIDLLCEGGGDSPSILRQFAGLAGATEIRRLIVLSPYWDADLNGLQALRKALGGPQTFIAVNPGNGTFPLGALPKKDDLKFVAFEGDDAERFLHAKIIVVETRMADHVLFGSANCSDDALGLLTRPARNVEACLYRRLAPHTALSHLEIDLRKTLARKNVMTPILQPNTGARGVHSIPSGEMEVVSRTLMWWPPAGFDANGASIRMKEVEVRPRAASNSKWVGDLPKSPSFPVVARVTYADGRVSDPVIVHATARLRRAAPSDINAALSDALIKARRGEADLLELALQAHVIFAPDRERESGHASIRSGKETVRPEKAVQYATPEAFRNAVALRAASGKSGLFAHDDPGLQEVVSIVLRGVNAAHSEDEAEFGDADDEADLLAGDTEDDSELVASDDDGDDRHNPGEREEPSEGPRIFTLEELHQRRTYLLKALDKFDELLKYLTKNPSKITSRIAGQTLFFLWLIRYGCRFDHRGITQGPSRLLVLFPRSDSERRSSFVLRAMWILKELWRGPKAIASHIKVDPRHGELQDDLYHFAVHSRWALARAYLLAAEQRDGSLAQHIAKAALEIVPATHRLGPVAADAERETMMALDADLGCTAAQTQALLRCCQEFEKAAIAKADSPVEAAPPPTKTRKREYS